MRVSCEIFVYLRLSAETGFSADMFENDLFVDEEVFYNNDNLCNVADSDGAVKKQCKEIVQRR